MSRGAAVGQAGRGMWATGRAAARMVWRAAPRMIACQVLLQIVVAVLPVAVAWLTKHVIDGLAQPAVTGPAWLLALSGGLVAAGLLLALLPRVAVFCEQEAGRAVGLRALDRLYRAVEGFRGLARFETPAFLDRLRLAQQSGASSPGSLVEAGLAVGGGLITTVGFLASLVMISPWMTVVVLVAAVPALIAQLRLSQQRAGLMWTLGPVERREAFFGMLLADVQAAKEIRLYEAGEFLLSRMLAERRVSDTARRRMDIRDLLAEGGLGLLSAGVAGAGLMWAIVLAYRGSISLGDVMMLLAAVGGVQGALAQITMSLAGAHQQVLLFDHYLAVVTAGPDLPAAAQPVAVPPLRRGIEIRDVWFRYSPEHPWALTGVDLFLPAHQAIALVGRNGAGKSTLVKLLCRMYDPTRGAILWDGVDLRDMDLADVRRRIGAVFQDFMHYDLSAAENIAIGDITSRPDHARITRAARSAGVHDTIAGLPRGYDTLLSRIFPDGTDKDDPEIGVMLSGGQWQRLAVARAFLRDRRDLMILDEPSSGLDAEAEHEVHTRLREHRRDRTSILISHRLGTIRDADHIVVLDRGMVIEQGDHDELITAAGHYATLFHLQADGYHSTVGAE